jgi:hypothetical protein
MPASRREFLAGALAVAATACTGYGRHDKTLPPPTISGVLTINSLTQGATQLSLLGLGPGAFGGERSDPIQSGASIVTFDLALSSQLIEAGTPQLYLATDENAPAEGPFPGVWTAFTGYEKTKDRSPKSPIPGVYAAQVHLPAAGLYTVAAVGPGGRAQGVGVTHVFVSDKPPNAVGSKATSVATPVATTEHALREICTRNPPDQMHYVSLDAALKNGKPTIAVFSTPLLCESRLCGPVTDEAMLVFERLGKAKANFVHVEEFLPGPDLKADASRLSPGFVAWGLRTEPWVFLIDKKGVIRARIQGPATAAMIDAALRPLL